MTTALEQKSLASCPTAVVTSKALMAIVVSGRRILPVFIFGFAFLEMLSRLLPTPRLPENHSVAVYWSTPHPPGHTNARHTHSGPAPTDAQISLVDNSDGVV
jgi:hypothetical protein